MPTSPLLDVPAGLTDTEADAVEGRSGPPVLRVTGLKKRYRRAGGSLVQAVDDVSLDVHAGEVLVLLGPSGCGKTTLLRCIAGLERPDAGRVEIHGQPMFDGGRHISVPTNKRALSMIFQSYALWPHMTAFENVAYPLRSRRVPKKQIEQRIMDILDLVGIADLRNQHPAQLSGGQQQRVALARALVSNDELVLFDEPLSNVDARVREHLRFELAAMQKRLGFAAVYVTHDQSEALSLADRIAVMAGGSVEQLGTPRQIYAEPHSRYVANFVGTTNELVGRVDAAPAGDGTVGIATDIGTIHAVATSVESGDEVVVTWRPERCTLIRDERAGVNRWKATVEASMYLGSHTEYLVDVDRVKLRIWSTDEASYLPGEECWLTVPPACIRALPP